MTTVYLAGAIKGLTRESATTWRERARDYLEQYGFEVLDPMKGKLIGGENLRDYLSTEVVHRDLWYVERADILLVEFNDRNRQYIGTICEMALARQAGKIIILWCDPEFAHDDYWLHWLTTKALGTLEECLDYIVTYLV